MTAQKNEERRHGDLGDYVNMRQAAELLEVSYQSVGNWVAAGELPVVKHGREKLIHIEDLESFVPPAKRKGGRPKGSKNKVVPLRRDEEPSQNGVAKRRLELGHHAHADEMSAVCHTLGKALTEVGDLTKKLSVATPETADMQLLRSDLRKAHEMMRRCTDFLVNPEFIRWGKAEEARDALLVDLRRELNGTR